VPKQTVRQALGPYMWHTIYSSLHQQGKCFFSVQLAGSTKIRVGIKDTSFAHAWLTKVKYELETLGFNIQNERTGEPMSDFLDGSDSDGSSSSRFTASMESHGSRVARGPGYNFNAVCQRQKSTPCMQPLVDAKGQ